ncbi:MAG: hypothetical protein ACD_76C00122G0008 [uncultured bacterium]|nr:MAG: hypothetical protein ACD_76C00122G0008 [uncultured bacterium]HBD05316.1 hypothetical protein [Candidatus Uhrbacteria bacterium]
MAMFFNKIETKERRRVLRLFQTKAEKLLWSKIKRKQLNGCKFRRQYGIGPYIVDFYCPEIRLAIEVDGPTHDNHLAKEYDDFRQRYIESLGIRVVRVYNEEVYCDIVSVISRIKSYLV